MSWAAGPHSDAERGSGSAGLFSATQTEAVEALARAGLRNPVRVAVAVEPAGGARSGAAPGQAPAGAGRRTPSSLRILFRTCQPEQKLGQLLRFLQARVPRSACCRSLAAGSLCGCQEAIGWSLQP